MAERSTAAVDVAHSGGQGGGEESPRTDTTEDTAADGATPQQEDREADAAAGADDSAEDTEPREDTASPPAPASREDGTVSSEEAARTPAVDARAPRPSPPPPELHSGHKLAKRYRLEECVTRLDGFSSWRAVDEKLRRAVGVHVLPADHRRVRPVLAAARSAALLGDPRFVQVLDAVEDGELVYVVHEWLPDATPLTALLAAGPLPAHEAYELVRHLAGALAAAHREGLAHLRLTPGAVLRTVTGQYRIRGLAVNAALRGISSDTPQRSDTEAVGALLYAALTRLWPYEEDAYGLSAATQLAGGTLMPPDQVRAGVHRGLSELAMRALVNDGATAASENPPCTTPEELVAAVAELPRIRPPEPEFVHPAPYERTTYQQGVLAADRGPVGPGNRPGLVADAPPALPGRTGKALKWGVAALLVAALSLGSWQVADTLLRGDRGTDTTQQNEDDAQEQSKDSPAKKPETGKPVSIESARILDPGGVGRESAKDAGLAFDGDEGSHWQTLYYASARFGNLKQGVGLILDLGSVQQVSTLDVRFRGETAVDFLAAPSSAGGEPDSLHDFSMVSSGRGSEVALEAKKPIKTRYVLVWLTELPLTEDGEYRGRITEIGIRS
ncbi:protein kinase family protein [Streptomyces chumphonensis]|uniref:non-specific serine/threonine protein kinase n=1 Tax=Streptomyces chumphonensis TaxID=1214925 RepID=A0A927F2Z7_9ACTN|nr:protein kinase family protein [Streptomyces chumphonensis]MBD3933244.1 protein kinase family protein [Streptomyces chumphonensis]